MISGLLWDMIGEQMSSLIVTELLEVCVPSESFPPSTDNLGLYLFTLKKAKIIKICIPITYKVIVNYKYIICQQKLNLIYSNVILFFILTPFLTLPSKPLLPLSLKLWNFTTPNETPMGVCADMVFLWHTE